MWWITLVLLLPQISTVLATFHEELTLRPLPDGTLSVSFDFSTYFDQSSGCKILASFAV